MHCKVYLSPSLGAVVGSANLSKPALDENDDAGQDARNKKPDRRTQIVPSPPTNLHPRIREYAKKVRHINLRDSIESVSVIQAIDPQNLDKDNQELLIDEIVSWTGHRGVYRNFLSRPISEVRKGLTMLFDESVDIRSRLEQIFRNGYLSGLRMPSLSLLLYWRNPERSPLITTEQNGSWMISSFRRGE